MASDFNDNMNLLTTEDVAESSHTSALGVAAKRKKNRPKFAWHGTAFVLEVVVLLLFIAISMAVVCTLFGKAFEIDQTANTLTRAMTLASTGSVNGAETFVANPDDEDCPSLVTYSFDGETFKEEGTYVSGMYVVKRTVEADESDAGTLYRARIDVSQYNNIVCSLTVACYKSNSGSVTRLSEPVPSEADELAQDEYYYAEGGE